MNPKHRLRNAVVTIVTTLALAGSLLVLAEPAAADGGEIDTYTDPAAHVDNPNGIAAGPDGNVWFTSQDNARIGRISPIGEITTFSDPANNVTAPEGITAGPDGNLWFASFVTNRIGRITPTGVITTFTDPSGNISGPTGITAGPDGNLWFTNFVNGRIGRITPTGVVTTFSDPGGNVSSPNQITSGPDGNVWFASQGTNRIGRITPAGVITTFTDPAANVSGPMGIAVGPDGNLWFTSNFNHRIGRITPAGAITTFTDPGGNVAQPQGIAAARDGNLWFVSAANNRIGRITPAGVITTFTDPGGNVSTPVLITAGPNRRLWFTSWGNHRIGRIEPPTTCNGWPPPHGFGDVAAGAWFSPALDWAACHGIASGFSGNVYRPNDPVNRAQAASMLWAFVDQPIGSPPHGFSDVAPTAWFARALDWATANGLVNGFSGNVYRPNDPVNRAQIVAWLWELMGQPAAVPHGFSDVSPSAWFSFALDWAKVKGLVSGFAGNVYRPNDPVNRAQIVDMLNDFASSDPAWTGWSGPELFTWRFPH